VNKLRFFKGKNLESITVFPFTYEFESITGIKQKNLWYINAMNGSCYLYLKLYKKNNTFQNKFCPYRQNTKEF